MVGPFRCPGSNEEIEWDFVCDGIEDCTSGGDESKAACAGNRVFLKKKTFYSTTCGKFVFITLSIIYFSDCLATDFDEEACWSYPQTGF